YVYCGHPKCASTWMSGIVLKVCNDLGMKPFYEQVAMRRTTVDMIKNSGADFIISQNTDYQKIAALEAYRGFHLIRDPRDLCISAYFSFLHSHPIREWEQLAELRAKLKSLNKEEGIREVIIFCERFLKFMDQWNYADENILDVKIEDLKEKPLANLIRIFDFMGLLNPEEENAMTSSIFQVKAFANKVLRQKQIPFDYRIPQKYISRAYLKELLDKLDFKKLSKGRKEGEEDSKSHYRKGTPGDWKNHFNGDHIELVKEYYGDLLVKLSYEKDLDW
ncbi:MAG: sulfotransferase domain-containing protein, partial [Bacteroidota bacterium]